MRACALGLFGAGLFGAVPAAHGQEQPAQRCVEMNGEGKQTCFSTAPKAPTAAGESAAKRFPFPGEDQPAAPQTAPAAKPGTSPAGSSDAPAAQRFPFPGESGGGQGSAPASAPAAKRFPFPGEGSPGGSALKDEGSSGDSSSSSSSSSSSGGSEDHTGADGLPPPENDGPFSKDGGDLPKPKRGLLAKKPKVAAKPTDAAREAEDVQVATFYQNDGNFRGAYDRAKDAIALDDTDAEAHLLLGEAARKLGRLDEAQQQYKRCLELDPVPKQRKMAQEALKSMTGGSS